MDAHHSCDLQRPRLDNVLRNDVLGGNILTLEQYNLLS